MPTAISDLSAEQQQQLAMQEGAKTPEDMITVLRMLAEDPENLARALSMMGLDVSPEQVQQAAQWMDQSAGDSAGIPPDGEQGEDEASAAAGEAAVPPTAEASAAPTADEEMAAMEEEGAPTPEPVVDEEAEAAPQAPPQGAPPMPQRPPMPNMDDVVSASVMQGGQAPAPMMRGSANLSKLRGPAGLRQPRGAGTGANTEQAAMIMKLMQAAQARRGAR